MENSKVNKVGYLILQQLANCDDVDGIEISEVGRRKMYYEFMKRLKSTFYTVDDFKKFIDEETAIVLTYQI